MALSPRRICRTCYRSRPASDFQHQRNRTPVTTCDYCRSITRNRRIVRQSASRISESQRTTPYPRRICSRCCRYKPETEFISPYRTEPVQTCRSCRDSRNTVGPVSSSSRLVLRYNNLSLSLLLLDRIRPIYNSDILFTTTYNTIYPTPICSYCNQFTYENELFATDPRGLIYICRSCWYLTVTFYLPFSTLALLRNNNLILTDLSIVFIWLWIIRI